VSPRKGAEPPVIFRYTREQAIEDGVLVDVSEMAREAGFRFPVALTQAVYAECVEVPEGVTGQDVSGRLWDVLWMLLVAVKASSGELSEVRYEVLVRNDDAKPAKLTHLKSLCGPGDEAEPVITIMFPNED
jgi:Family of unknown function (DUF6573)